ncbi:AAA domain-containing protein, putative AbiEii toxin, Type IV TA system [Pseudomonas libanensis]|uniref:ATPase AAA-type core domain-containing protein n=1 Tax=Pseudomonas libanensis TaxID=75588 RepID=A0A0R2YAW0_9PSED|nr:AAA family ATPase [Pseudomonas libanensis]KRP45447.1 hypothetical protein TU73_13690 [Pseudomonas libanensis]SDK63337.1 AAA domain-containing protein, putative AbiEii toxin, Type IV TA system [Pseudomonas libanensis]
MISKIEVDDRVINLNLEKDGTPNIFDIDSISLIIGNNGSGKTTIFKKIIDKFLPSSRFGRYFCDVILDSQKELTYEEMRNRWGVIYYSPVQHGRRVHATRNFVDVSPKWGESISAFDLRPYTQILSAFDISPKIYVSKTINIRNTCKKLIDLLLVKSETNDVPIKLAELFPDLFRYFDHLRNPKPVMSLEFSSFSIEEKSDEPIEEDVIKKRIIDVSADILYCELRQNAKNKESLFALFIVLEYYLTTRTPDRVFQHIVFEAIGIRDAWFIGARPEKAERLYEEVDAIDKFLTLRAAHITSGSKAYAEVALAPSEDASFLKNSGIDHFFDVGFQNMSSGQFAVVAQLALLSDAITAYAKKGIDKLLVLIDEGDAFLHLEWQRRYISQLNSLLSDLKKQRQISSLQLIIATHSPLLATDIPKQFICRMESFGESITPSAFAAPLHTLLNQSFGAKTIGEFASTKIKSAIDAIKLGQDSTLDNFIVESIDNSIIKAEILRISEYTKDRN